MQFLLRSTSQCFRTILVLALSLGCVVQQSGGQQVGIDICSCAPSTYEFQFDFSLFCPPINITQGDAVVDTSCLVSPFQDQSVGDLVPIAVQEITVLELDQNLDNLYQEIIRGSFKDGDTWSYTSVAAQPGRTDPNSLPRGIQFNIVGINILEQPIINTVIITFSNSCQAYPVLIPGQYAGWVRFLELEDPLADYCPFTPDEPSAAPSPFTPGPTFPPTPPFMSMSMDLGMLDLLEDEFGLQRSDCTESSSSRYTKKSRAGKGGKGGSSPKGSKKMGKGGAGKGGSSGDLSSMMTDSSLKSDSSSKGKGGKGGKGSESGSRRLLRSKGSKRIGDCDGKGGKGGKATKKDGSSGKGESSSGKGGSSSGKGESSSGKGGSTSGKGGSTSGKGGSTSGKSGSSSGKSGKKDSKGSKKESKKNGKGGKGGKGSKSGKSYSGSGSSKGKDKLSKKESSESRRFIL